MSENVVSDRITSTRDARVKALAKLARSRHRREQRRHLVEGPNAVGAALAAGFVDEILGTPEGLQGLDVAADVRVIEVADHVLERIADVRTHQGVVAVARSVTTDLAAVVGSGLLVVLAGLSDPGNVGTIVRTADAVGARGVILTTGSADVFSPKAVRAAAGSTYHLALVIDESLEEVSATCRGAGQHIYGLDAAGEVPLEQLAEGRGPVALVLGNEAHGLIQADGPVLDGKVAIALRGRAESLNVAAAAAIAMFVASNRDPMEG